MEGSGDNIILLLLGELDEVNCITGYTDSKLRIILRVLLSVKKSVSCEYVNVQMMSSLCCISVQKTDKVVDLLCICCHSKKLLS